MEHDTLPPMRRARIGRSAVELSVVGLGTCSLRLLPEEQAYATLRRALDEGIDWFHTSPDYGGADELVARAIRDSGRPAIAVSDGSGAPEHFRSGYERARRLAGSERLALWGISCIDDQELVGHDVWGPAGMVEFMLAEKRAGRLGATYCTTHGTPEYVAGLVRSGAFDAIMLALNPLGFHVLSSYAASEGRPAEDLARNAAEVLRIAEASGVSILAMKALGGGLLARSRAFPPRALLAPERAELCAEDVLRYTLAQRGVTAVVPGAGTPEEAAEDARAGRGAAALADHERALVEQRVAALRARLCSRCGACEATCSRGLPISWLFRDGYMWLNPGDTFDAVPRLDSRHLRGEAALACATCDDPTCLCPAGLEVPRELERVHLAMQDLEQRGLLPLPPAALDTAARGSEPRAIVVQRELPDPASGGTYRLWLENRGERPWRHAPGQDDHVRLVVEVGARVERTLSLRADCHPGERVHLVFTLPALAEDPLSLRLVRDGSPDGVELLALSRGTR